MSGETFEQRIARWVEAIPIESAGAGDAAAFVELFNSIYQRPVSTAYCGWRFSDADARTAAFVCRDGDRLKGVAGLQSSQMAGAAEFRTALYLDVIVEKRQQGTGLLFSALNRALLQSASASGAAACCLFPNPRGTRAWLKDPTYTALDSRITFACPTRSEYPELEVQAIDRFGDWVTEIGQSFTREHPHLAAIRRDPRYLNWRFTSHPQHRYHLFQVARSQRPFGYLVLKVFTDPVSGSSFGDIVDLLWAEDDLETLTDMLRFAGSFFFSRKIAQATIWLQSNTILDEAGLQAGFSATSQTRTFCCKVLDPQYEWLRDSKRWFVTMSDCEIY